MIVTLTAHPSLDRTVELAAPLRVGDVQRGLVQHEDSGGKGVNVARVLHAAGAPVTALLPLDPADPYRSTLDAGLPVVTTEAGGRTRSNLTLTDDQGTTTKINLPGPTLDAAHAQALVDTTAELADGADWLALCGSLPPGAPSDLYARIIREVRARCPEAAPRIAVDASGPTLTAVLADADCTPDLIKPNEEELEDAVATLGLHPEQPGDDVLATAVAQARDLVPERVRAVLVTLGGDGGALVLPHATYVGPVPEGARVRSTVGAGDSALAGYLLADTRGSSPAQALASALRHGTATASLPGTALARPEDLPAAPTITEIASDETPDPSMRRKS